MVRFPQEIPSDLRFKIAETKEELEQAFSLLHDAYVKEGLMTPQPSGLRVTKYHALPSTTTLIALHGDLVVGTVSLVRQNAFGLPLEAIFDLDQLPPGSRPAEVSSLAIRKDFQQQQGRILFPLLKFMHQYSVEYFGVTHFVIAVNPKWYTFYESVLLFSRLSSKIVSSYDFVNGAPAVGAVLDLRAAHRNYVSVYGKRAPSRNLSRFFFDLEPPNMEFPLRKKGVISDPVLSPELIKHFFIDKTSTFERLSDFERLILRGMYNTREFLDLIPKAEVIPLWSREEKRYDASLRARIMLPDGRSIPLEVQCVSSHGLGGTLSVTLPPGSYDIQVDSEDYLPCSLKGSILWVSPRRRFGFSIDKRANGSTGDDVARWERFIANLENRLLGRSKGPAVAQESPSDASDPRVRLSKV